MKVSLDQFELPFATADDPNEDVSTSQDEEQKLGRDELRERLESRIPTEATHLGMIERTVDNFMTWTLEDHFYVVPWNQDGFEWAVFMITWDDNWEQWEFVTIGRCAGTAEWRRAAFETLEVAFRSWGLLDDPDEADLHKEFLSSLRTEKNRND